MLFVLLLFTLKLDIHYDDIIQVHNYIALAKVDCKQQLFFIQGKSLDLPPSIPPTHA